MGMGGEKNRTVGQVFYEIKAAGLEASHKAIMESVEKELSDLGDQVTDMEEKLRTSKETIEACSQKILELKEKKLVLKEQLKAGIDKITSLVKDKENMEKNTAQAIKKAQELEETMRDALAGCSPLIIDPAFSDKEKEFARIIATVRAILEHGIDEK